MPTDYLIDTEQRAVFTLCVGTISILDLLDHMSRLQADPRFSPGFCQIADFRHVQAANLSSADIRSLATQSLFDAATRRALVIGTDSAFGPARQYAESRGREGEPNVRTVHDIEQAAEWTGIDLAAAKQAFEHLTQRMQTAS